MGGTSTSNTQQQSQTTPWAQSQPSVNGLFSLLNNGIGQTGVTVPQNAAFNQIENNAGTTSGYTPQINGVTSSLLSGGGALNQAPMIQAAYNNYGAQTSPLASNTDYNPMNTPGIGAQLSALTDNISNGINSQFASAGRDMSGYNQKAVAQGLSAGLAPVLTGQYNQNVQNQQTAANNLYGAGNATGGLLTNLGQQDLQNRVAGVGQVGAGLDASNYGANTVLQAESQRQGIPINQLGLLSQIGIPLAQLGTNQSGTSNTQTTASPLQQFAQFGQGFNGIFGNFGLNKAFPSIV